MASIEWDLKNEKGPRVLIWGDVEAEEVDNKCPEGWAVDWDIVPAALHVLVNGERGYSFPLRSVR